MRHLYAPAPRRNGNRDKRYASRRWKETRLLILRRDNWTCTIRQSTRCRGTANEVDHIISPNPYLGAGDFWDPANLRAACAPCNNERNNPAQRSAEANRYFSGHRLQDSPLANLSLRRTNLVVAGDYSRRKPTDGADAS